jgi:hypothetical protein
MTDLEKFKETYAQFGIELKTYIGDNGNTFVDLNGFEDSSTRSDKFDGYGSFMSDVEFDTNGKFLRQGFWE